MDILRLQEKLSLFLTAQIECSNIYTERPSTDIVQEDQEMSKPTQKKVIKNSAGRGQGFTRQGIKLERGETDKPSV